MKPIERDTLESGHVARSQSNSGDAQEVFRLSQ